MPKQVRKAAALFMPVCEVTFQDTFSFATVTKTVILNDDQFQNALKQKKAKSIVISTFKNHIHWNFFISNIKIINQTGVPDEVHLPADATTSPQGSGKFNV